MTNITNQHPNHSKLPNMATASTAEHRSKKRLSEVTKQYMTEVKKPRNERKMIRTSVKRGRNELLPDVLLKENAAMTSSVVSRKNSAIRGSSAKNSRLHEKNPHLLINFEEAGNGSKNPTPLRSLSRNRTEQEMRVFRTPRKGA